MSVFSCSEKPTIRHMSVRWLFEKVLVGHMSVHLFFRRPRLAICLSTCGLERPWLAICLFTRCLFYLSFGPSSNASCYNLQDHFFRRVKVRFNVRSIIHAIVRPRVCPAHPPPAKMLRQSARHTAQLFHGNIIRQKDLRFLSESTNLDTSCEYTPQPGRFPLCIFCEFLHSCRRTPQNAGP